MTREFVARIGTFFVIIGVWILILFIASALAKDANFDYLFWSILAIAVGMMMRGRREPKPRSERFGYVRRLRSRKHPEKGK